MSRNIFKKGNIIGIMYINSNYLYYEEVDDIMKTTIDYDDIISIDCSNNKIDDIKGISIFKNLYEFKCNDNKVKDFSELKLMKSLVYLSIRNNNITKVPDLPSSLLELDISRNRLKNIDIKHLYNLKILNASFNMLQRISNKDFIREDNTIIEIHELYLSHNNIKNFDLSINSLEKLCIDNNNISSFPSDKLLSSNLVYFDCSMNKISTFENILEIIDINNLQNLYSYGNPYENYQKLENNHLSKYGSSAIICSNCFNKPNEKKTLLDTYEDTEYEFKKVSNNRKSKFKDFYDEYY